MKNNIIYIIIASIAVAVIGTTAVVVSSHAPTQISPATETNIQNNVTIQATIQNIKKFNSIDELQKFLLDSQIQASAQNYGGPVRGAALEQLGRAQTGATAPVPSMAVGAPTPENQQVTPTTNAGVQYSTTNIQVSGIDEPDFLKNDNKYAYILSQDKLTIIDAYPGDAAKIVAKVGLDVKGENLQNMFLNKDRLLFFTTITRSATPYHSMITFQI